MAPLSLSQHQPLNMEDEYVKQELFLIYEEPLSSNSWPSVKSHLHIQPGKLIYRPLYDLASFTKFISFLKSISAPMEAFACKQRLP